MSVTIWLVIGGLAGWTTAKLMASPEGVVVNVVIGMLGAFVGGWAAPLIGDGTVAAGGFSVGGIAVSLLGALLLLAIVNVLRRGHAR